MNPLERKDAFVSSIELEEFERFIGSLRLGDWIAGIHEHESDRFWMPLWRSTRFGLTDRVLAREAPSCGLPVAARMFARDVAWFLVKRIATSGTPGPRDSNRPSTPAPPGSGGLRTE